MPGPIQASGLPPITVQPCMIVDPDPSSIVSLPLATKSAVSSKLPSVDQVVAAGLKPSVTLPLLAPAEVLLTPTAMPERVVVAPAAVGRTAPLP